MKKILVIEDNTEVRENLCEILDLANYETFQAENGKVGVGLAKEICPDLILCDVMMPVLDGYGVLHILNRDPVLMQIPFLFLTAKAEKEDFRKGMSLGADDYITKPFDEVELMHAIEMRLKKSKQLASIHNNDSGVRQFFNEARAEEALKDLSQDQEHRKYQKKSFIYEEGRYAKYLYYIINGQAKSIQLSDSGKELITHVYGAGDFLGLVALLQDIPYQDSAVCSEDCELLLIPAEDFKMLMFNDRDFSAKFIQLLAHHASHTETQLIDLAYSSVRKKVAKALLAFSEANHADNFAITRDDLAAKAGTARETVIRTLADFKSEKLIDLEDGKIQILNKVKLQELPQ